ncbi:MAG: SHOCT domain-containing protein [bacterium]|nr:SHOCT domain-containing protein [bacterium]
MRLVIIGCGIDVFVEIIYMIVMIGEMQVYRVFFLIPAILAAIFEMLQIKSLAKNERHVCIGVMNILFCGIVGGILYLVWNPSEVNPTAAVQEIGENSSRIIETNIANKQEQKQPEESIADQLLKLKDLRDMGAITEEEYEAKRAELMKKL